MQTDQNDPNLDTIAELQRSITATLTFLMGQASVAELFGLQGYLSQMASRMTDVGAGNQRLGPMPGVLSEQLAELERQRQALRDSDARDQELERRRQQAMYQKALAQQVAGQYRQEG